MWIVKKQHNFGSDINISKAKDKEDAIKKLKKFYESYDFKLVGKKLQDLDGSEDNLDVRYDKKGNVIYFIHADGDGPIGQIEYIR